MGHRHLIPARGVATTGTAVVGTRDAALLQPGCAAISGPEGAAVGTNSGILCPATHDRLQTTARRSPHQTSYRWQLRKGLREGTHTSGRRVSRGINGESGGTIPSVPAEGGWTRTGLGLAAHAQ